MVGTHQAVALALHERGLDAPVRLLHQPIVQPHSSSDIVRDNGGDSASDEEKPPEPVVPDLPGPEPPRAENIRHRSASIVWNSVAPAYPPGTEDAAKGDYEVLYELQLVQVRRAGATCRRARARGA